MRQIIEQLSDGVSQLVLMVVVLQEQNADVPANLPNAAQAVLGTAVTLGKVATQLAGTNYKNFPDIAKEIVDAATAVQSATDTMTTAMKTLQTSADRKVRFLSPAYSSHTINGLTMFASSFRLVGPAWSMLAELCPEKRSNFFRSSTVLS